MMTSWYLPYHVSLHQWEHEWLGGGERMAGFCSEIDYKGYIGILWPYGETSTRYFLAYLQYSYLLTDLHELEKHTGKVGFHNKYQQHMNTQV